VIPSGNVASVLIVSDRSIVRLVNAPSTTPVVAVSVRLPVCVHAPLTFRVPVTVRVPVPQVVVGDAPTRRMVPDEIVTPPVLVIVNVVALRLSPASWIVAVPPPTKLIVPIAFVIVDVALMVSPPDRVIVGVDVPVRMPVVALDDSVPLPVLTRSPSQRSSPVTVTDPVPSWIEGFNPTRQIVFAAIVMDLLEPTPMMNVVPESLSPVSVKVAVAVPANVIVPIALVIVDVGLTVKPLSRDSVGVLVPVNVPVPEETLIAPVCVQSPSHLTVPVANRVPVPRVVVGDAPRRMIVLAAMVTLLPVLLMIHVVPDSLSAVSVNVGVPPPMYVIVPIGFVIVLVVLIVMLLVSDMVGVPVPVSVPVLAETMIPAL
jgi:hypothetical protein